MIKGLSCLITYTAQLFSRKATPPVNLMSMGGDSVKRYAQKGIMNHSSNILVGFGGGCHWCTEAVFASLQGVTSVKQGWIRSFDEADNFSEAVLLTFDPSTIELQELIDIHLMTHSSTSQHKFRQKYRSAVYVLDQPMLEKAQSIIQHIGQRDNKTFVTQALYFKEFKPSPNKYLNYYYANSDRPFCQTYIKPKLQTLKEKYAQKLTPNAHASTSY